MAPLSIADVVVGAVSEVRRHWRTLLQALLLPAAAVALIDVAASRLELSGVAWTIAVAVAQTPFQALFAIACHRIVLLGENSLESRWGLHWSARELRFCLWLTASGMVFAGAVALLLLLPVRVIILFSLPLLFTAAYALSRLSLILPATAIDETPGLESVWELSRGNGWRLTIALAIVPLVVDVAALSVAFRTLSSALAPQGAAAGGGGATSASVSSSVST